MVDKTPVSQDGGELWAKYLLGLGLIVLGGAILMQAFGYKSEYIQVYEGAFAIVAGLFVAFHRTK